MKVLIIGGTGFAGPYVAHGLVRSGWEAYVFNRGRTPVELSPKVRRLMGDREALPDHAPLFRKLLPMWFWT